MTDVELRTTACGPTATPWRPIAGSCWSSTAFVDLARKVVGVGSVGTRAWIALLLGRDDQDPLFLQLKEAEASVLEAYVGTSATRTTASGWSPASA